MKINRNISAVLVNEQLLRNENGLAESLERLSSGFKFNHAKDNPSGVAISYKMQAQINALDRASANTTDGLSIAQTIDGSIGEMTEVAQRIRELCVQAANDTNTQEDKEAIQLEVDQLKQEIDRISRDTEFNGKTLLDGSLDRRTYVTDKEKTQSFYQDISNIIISDGVQPGQYGVKVNKSGTKAEKSGAANTTINKIEANQAGTITINGAKTEITEGMEPSEVFDAIRKAADQGGVDVTTQSTYSSIGQQLDFTQQKVGSSYGIDITFSSQELRDAIVGTTWDSQKTVGTNAIIDLNITQTAATKRYSGISTNPTTTGGNIYINGQPAIITAGMSADQVLQEITAKASAAGIDVTQDGDSIVFTQKNPGSKNTIDISFDSGLENLLGTLDSESSSDGLDAGNDFSPEASTLVDGNQVIIRDKSGFEMSFEVSENISGKTYYIEASDIGTLQLQIGTNEGNELAVRVPVLNTTSLHIKDLDVSKIGGAAEGIAAMDKALQQISEARSKVGAYENSLEFAQKSLDANNENMTSAISRLEDTDMAKEMTRYTSYNVLNQASISVLAQANDMPKQILSLLQF